jgi:hypothetical protein
VKPPQRLIIIIIIIIIIIGKAVSYIIIRSSTALFVIYRSPTVSDNGTGKGKVVPRH